MWSLHLQDLDQGPQHQEDWNGEKGKREKFKVLTQNSMTQYSQSVLLS